jgi:hypothetical protein
LHRSRAHVRSLVLLVVVTWGQGTLASPCMAPERPYLPSTQEDMRAYAELLRKDFESYIAAVQDYFRCLDEERARAFAEAKEVSADYGRLVDAIQ